MLYRIAICDDEVRWNSGRICLQLAMAVRGIYISMLKNCSAERRYQLFPSSFKKENKLYFKTFILDHTKATLF